MAKLTKGELIAEMKRRHEERVVIDITHDDYLRAAVEVMFEVTAEHLAGDTASDG